MREKGIETSMRMHKQQMKLQQSSRESKNMKVLLQAQERWLNKQANAQTTNEVAIEFSRKRERERFTSRKFVRQVCECTNNK